MRAHQGSRQRSYKRGTSPNQPQRRATRLSTSQSGWRPARMVHLRLPAMTTAVAMAAAAAAVAVVAALVATAAVAAVTAATCLEMRCLAVARAARAAGEGRERRRTQLWYHRVLHDLPGTKPARSRTPRRDSHCSPGALSSMACMCPPGSRRTNRCKVGARWQAVC